MADPILIGSEIKSVPGIDNAKQIYAYRDNDTTAVRALQDANNPGSAYQVPVDRKCIIFQCYFGYPSTSAGRSEFRIWENNAVAAAGNVKYFGHVSNYQAAIYPHVYMEFSAGNYIINEPTGSNSVNCALIGVELDA